MATIDQSIDVDVPVFVAYNQWTQFETFPQFLQGVEKVEQIDETTLHFLINTAGVRREYTARVLDQVPDSFIRWESTEGSRSSGLVRFEAMGDHRTRVSVRIDWEPRSFVETAGAVLGADSLQVGAGLRQFKDFLEHRGVETGAWRSTVSSGEVQDTAPRPRGVLAAQEASDAGLQPAAPGDAVQDPRLHVDPIDDALRNGDSHRHENES